MRKITLVILMSLLSWVGYSQFPEGFEGTWSPSGPAVGWGIYQNEVGLGQQWRQTVGFPTNPVEPVHSGTFAAVITRENVPNTTPPNPAKDWMVTPAFTLPPNAQLRFWSTLVAPGNAGGVFKVMIIPAASDASVLSNYTDVITWTEPTLDPGGNIDYEEKLVSIPATPGLVRLAFYMEGDNADSWLIDDVNVVSECLMPTALTATNVGTTTAVLGWTGTAPSYDVEIVLNAGSPTGTPTDTNIPGTSYTENNNLVPDTAYKFYVRAVCSPGNPSPWAGPFSFTTVGIGDNCAAPIVIGGLPFSATDNTSNYGDNFDGTPGATGCGTTAAYLNGDEVVYAYTAATTGAISVSMTNNGANSGMFVYNSCANIGVSCVGGGIGNAATPVNIPTLSVIAGTTYYIVISSSTTQSTPYTLTVQTVTCPPPSNIAATGVDADSATLSWNANGATSWEIVVQPLGTGIPTGAGTTVTNNINLNVTATIPGGVPLNPSTAYEVYIRADCGAGDGTFSQWAPPLVFTTTQIAAALPLVDGFEGPISWTMNNGTQTNKWTVGTAVAFSGTHSLYITDDNGVSNSFTNTASTVVHAYRDIQMPTLADQMNLSYEWRALAESCCDYLQVWVAPGSFNPTPGTMITAVPGSIVQIGGNMNGNANWTHVDAVINGQPYQNGVMRLIFQWRNDPSIGNDPPAAVDNVNLSLITCPAPTALTMANLEQDEATITWTGPSSVTPTFDGYLSTSSTPPTGTTTPTQENLPTPTVTLPLAPSTTYYFWVRSDCGSGDVSTWTGPISFNTPQIPATTDFVDGFEGPNMNWTLNNGTQTNKWTVGTAVASSGTHSLYITDDNGVSNSFTNTSTSVVHAYRDITIPSDVDQLLLSYDWRGVAEMCCDYLQVWIVPLSYTPVPGTMINNTGGNTQYGGNMNSNPNWITVNQIIDATAYEGTTIRLVFQWRNDPSVGNDPPAAVDNVNLSVITCPSPTALVLNSVDQDSAQISWTAPGTAPDGYDYFVSTTNTTPAEDVVVTGSVDSPTTTATIDPLIPSTTYYVWVRSDCGEDDVSFWVGPLQFNTTQIPADLNYTDDFEGTVEWSFVNGTGINKWVVGTAVNNGGTHSLYVTNDNGVSNAYTDNSFTVLHAYRDFQLPDVVGNVFISFDWRNQAESCCDFLNVWLVPTTFTPVAGTQITPGPDRFQILNNENGQLAFVNNMYTFAANAYGGDTMRLIFQWKHDGSVNVQPPAAIDNINIIVETCPAPVNLISNSIPGSTEVELTWTPIGTETQWELVIQPFETGNPGTAPADSIILDEPTYTFEPVEGEFYEFYVRAICGPGDVGLWAGPLPFSIFNPPGCANVEVLDPSLEIVAPGGDIVICPDEPDDCIDLSANYMETGQSDQYIIEEIDYDPPFPFSGGTPLAVGTDDVWSPVVTLPFNVCFFGEIYNQCLVGANGVISFNVGIPNHMPELFCPYDLPGPLPNVNSQIKNAIYGVWQDIDPSVENSFAHPDINYQVLGNYPCRALVVNYSEVAQWHSSCNNDPAIGAQTTQIVMYEISNVIEVYVGRRVACNGWNTGEGVIGLLNEAGTVAYTPPGRNTGNWTAIEEAWRFTPSGTPNVVFEWLEQVGPNPEDVVFVTNETDLNVCITDVERTFIARATYEACTGEELVRSSQVTIRKAEEIDEDEAIDLVECPNEDGSATFDLPESMVDIIAGLTDPADFTITYYLSQAAAEAGGTDNLPEEYTTSTLPSTIYARIVDTQADCPAIIADFTISISTDIPDYELEGDLEICDNETTEISVEPAIAGATYEWTQDGDPLPDTGSSITVSEPGVYGVTVTTGCPVTKSVTVTETPAPAVDDLADVAECDEFILPALVNPNNAYYTAPGGPDGEGEQLFAGEPITSSQTIYIFAQNGECTAESSFDVTITPTPVFTVTDPQLVCDYTTTTISVIGDIVNNPDAEFEWTFDDGQTIVVVGNASSITATGYGIYVVTVTLNGCTDTSSTTVTQDMTPLAFSLGEDKVVCDYELALMEVDADFANATYVWTYEGNPVGGNTRSLQAVGFGTYEVTVTVGDCSGSANVEVIPDTDAFALALSHGCEGNIYMVHLDPVEDAEGNLSFNPDTATVSWTGPAGFSSSNADIQAESEGIYTVTVTTPEGCVSQGAVEVLSTTCLIPRGISPNNDTMNDNFDLTGFNVTKLSIFNRYGREVYSFGGSYTNQWYGQTDNGEELPTGTYFFSLERNNGETKTGWVYINRQEN